MSNPTHLWRTTNGGVSWSTENFTPPPSLPPAALGLYGSPTFDGSLGVEAVDYPVGGHQAIYFYETHDAGKSWTLDTDLSQPIGVGDALNINRRNAAAQSCFGPVTSSRVAVVSSAGTATWWILQPGPKGATRRIVVGHGGSGTTSYVMKGLPATTGHVQVAALNINDALLTLPNPSGYQSTFETSNGGVTWEKMSPVASGWTVSDVAPNCATRNLRITLGRTGAGLGHIGMYFYVKNVGTRTCELDGYPTLQMTANSKPVATLVTFGSDYTVPSVSPRDTVVNPGGRAVFMLGYSDQTGYGSSRCPTATTLAITPPGNLVSQDLRLQIQPYGGGTIQTLVCGEIAVSPIMSLATWKQIA